MTRRQQFLEYVDRGGAPICSPQIGAGAGFDTKLAGKTSVWDTTLDDTIAAVARFDIVPLVNVGLPDWGECCTALRWHVIDQSEDAGRATVTDELRTPVGTLTRTMARDDRGGYFTKQAVQTEADLAPLAYYIDAALEADTSRLTDYTREVRERVGEDAALSIQWAVQPYELLCFPSTQDTALLAHDCPERVLPLMDKIVDLDRRAMEAVAAAGADFIFLGGPAAEMISPDYYRKFLVPYSQQATQIAHALGLRVYSHICSPIEPFLSLGFYNQMGIDLFETLSPPPVGNVKSLADAMAKIDPSICTRGNMGLDVLLQADVDTVRAATLNMLEETKGRKHMVAASDYLFYDVPETNVHAMAAAVREFRGD